MLLTVGETFGLFTDIEKNEDSSFEMAILDFSLNSGSDFSPDLEETQLISSRTVNLNKDGTLGFKYKVRTENFDGDLCSYLSLKDNLSGTYQSLSSFISDETIFSAMPRLIFTSE